MHAYNYEHINIYSALLNLYIGLFNNLEFSIPETLYLIIQQFSVERYSGSVLHAFKDSYTSLIYRLDPRNYRSTSHIHKKRKKTE